MRLETGHPRRRQSDVEPLHFEDLDAFYAAREANGVTFTAPPTPLHGSRIARFLDSEGAETSVSG